MAYKMSDDESDVVIPWTALASSRSKMFNSTELHFSEVTSFKINTLGIFRQINAVYFLSLKTRQIVVGQTANENLA